MLPGNRPFVTPSAVIQARQRLGSEAVRRVFTQTAQLWHEATPHPHWCGLTLLAIDGVFWRTPDTPENGSPPLLRTKLKKKLDLNELCIRRHASTFFVRASGSSMQELGLCEGDVMVVDRAEEASHGNIVIAEVNGELTVKRLQLHPRLALFPMNPAYSVIYPEELQLLGVVTWFFNSTQAQEVTMPMFGLAHVNSFYASSEVFFRPDLRGKPVVVLNNND